MKFNLFLSIAAASLLAAVLSGCSGDPQVAARHVPERADDFVWENDIVCYRAYGKALESETLSPGFDVWVKVPGKLVADQWYAAAVSDPEYYHHNHGDGKDCYKVGVSLGAGASAVLIDGELVFPATNWRSSEILEQSGDKVVFVLHYPEWEADGCRFSLDKKITVTKGSHFCEAEDCWTFSGNGSDVITVAAGVVRHDVHDDIIEGDRIAIWEEASDQSKESEDGMIGLAVQMPGGKAGMTKDNAHAIVSKAIRSGEPLRYRFGSCWTGGGEICDSGMWFDLVKSL